MYRGTTPTIYIKSNLDLTDWEVVEVAIKNRHGILLVKTDDDVTIETETGKEGCLLYVSLTQEETLSLKSSYAALIQIRAYNEGAAVASTICSVPVDEILRDGLIGIGGDE